MFVFILLKISISTHDQLIFYAYTATPNQLDSIKIYFHPIKLTVYNHHDMAIHILYPHHSHLVFMLYVIC